MIKPKFEGPGFETFRSNFSLIFQKYDKRHTRCAFTKLLKLIYQLSRKQFEDYADFLARAFKADHNVLTELPYDFSQLLQNFDTKNVTLGYNQWMCSCHAEITSVVRRFLLFFLSNVHTNSKLCKRNICSFIACTLIQPYSYHGRSFQQYENRFLCNLHISKL